jgi:arsenite oxidase small subunit
VGESPDKDDPVDDKRRTFIKIAVTASALLAAGGIGAIGKSIVNPGLATGISAPTTFPRVKVTNLTSLVVNLPVTFFYPLDDEPNIIVKLGQKVPDGIGPDGDIIAFSQICQHLGCTYGFQPKGATPSCNSSYVTDRPVGYCCCHGSVYDFTNDAKVISGPAPRPLPRVVMEVDSSGDIYATGMTAPTIFGHGTGSSDVTQDLLGGNLVGT